MENIHSYFVPECYFDTVLLRKILQTNKRLKHTKGCPNVVNRFRIIKAKKGDLYDSPFGVGMVDKDKSDLDFLKECNQLGSIENLILWRHRDITKKHFIIQLNPPLEKWVVDILERNNLKIEDFDYSRDFKRLKKGIKDDIDNENDKKLNNLVSGLIKLNDEAVNKLKDVLLYLWHRNIDSSDEELKKIFE